MTINPLKKLENAREVTVKESEAIISEVKLLLDSAGQAEREALKIVGLEYHVSHVENKKGIEIERKKFEKDYASNVFTEGEVKSICVKYDLRMLPTRLFIGQLDNQVAIKLKTFIENHKSHIGNYSDDFYIIAPPKAFRLTEQPLKPKRIDPILLYRIPGSGHGVNAKYVLIHKWGKDFTFLRRVSALKYSSLFSLRVYWSLLLTLYTTIGVSLFANPISAWGGWFIPSVFSIWYVLAIIPYWMATNEIDSMKEIQRKLGNFTSSELWNSTNKRAVFR